MNILIIFIINFYDIDYTLEIACGVLGGIGFITAVIALIVYRYQTG